MVEPIKLRGMTWDHSRGFDPMVVTSVAYMDAHPGVEISWEKRSLQAFADRPIAEMAAQYDLMVIDHPHVGEVAGSGQLLALDMPARAEEIADLAAHSVGASHRSYNFGGRQWALAIDAATPVASFRADMLDAAPTSWEGVMDLARKGRVACPLIPINALMTFMGLARNMDVPLVEDQAELIDAQWGIQVLSLMTELVAHIDARCLTLDPIGVAEWMGRNVNAPAYSPFGYGYTNYSRPGYCRFPLTYSNAPGIADNGPRGTVIGGTGIAVSAQCAAPDIAVDYAFWIAGAECQAGLYFTSGGQPGHAAAWDSDACNAAAGNFFRNTRATLESAWLRPRYSGYMGFQDQGSNIIHAHLRGETDAATALNALQTAYLVSRR